MYYILPQKQRKLGQKYIQVNLHDIIRLNHFCLLGTRQKKNQLKPNRFTIKSLILSMLDVGTICKMSALFTTRYCDSLSLHQAKDYSIYHQHVF